MTPGANLAPVAVEVWGGAYATQPTNRVVWPHERSAYGGVSGPFVWDVASAIRVPSVSRATSLYSGLIRQCSMDAYRGADPLPRPRLLDRPDPTDSRAHFVGLQVEDYLWHGNALSVITGRNAEGWPASVAWLPAAWCAITWTPGEFAPLLRGRERGPPRGHHPCPPERGSVDPGPGDGGH